MVDPNGLGVYGEREKPPQLLGGVTGYGCGKHVRMTPHRRLSTSVWRRIVTDGGVRVLVSTSGAGAVSPVPPTVSCGKVLRLGLTGVGAKRS